MANNMYALVLFDVDGCTAVVESKKLKMEGKDLVTGQMGHMTFAREKLQVEILQLSDSKRALNKYEDEWSLSCRSVALDKEKARRRNRPNGYLTVRPAEQNVEIEETVTLEVESEAVTDASTEDLEDATENPQRPHREKTQKNEKTGSKGRKIAVLYEGSGDYSAEASSPKRAPSFLEELTEDEQDLVNLQVQQHLNSQRSVSTQTDRVVIVGPEDNLPVQHSSMLSSISGC